MSANDPRIIKILDLLLFGTKKKKSLIFRLSLKQKRKRGEETSILVVASSSQHRYLRCNGAAQIRFKAVKENPCNP